MMMKRFLAIITLLVTLLAPLGAQGAKPEKSPAAQKEAVAGALLTNDEKVSLAKRVLFDEEPFLQSFQAQYSQTLNLFFKNEDYQILRGNPFVGYSAVLGFRWPKGTKEVAFLGVGAAQQITDPGVVVDHQDLVGFGCSLIHVTPNDVFVTEPILKGWQGPCGFFPIA